jgi:hypothetical protein
MKKLLIILLFLSCQLKAQEYYSAKKARSKQAQVVITTILVTMYMQVDSRVNPFRMEPNNRHVRFCRDKMMNGIFMAAGFAIVLDNVKIKRHAKRPLDN